MLKRKILVKKIHKDAIIPKLQNKGDAGLDLSSVENVTIKAKEFCVVSTGLCFEIPKNYEIQIRPRSGLSAKFGVSVLNAPGTIDSGYRGEVKVILFNFSNNDFVVEKGMRIAQMVVNKLSKFSLKETFEVNTNTQRNDNGFGSTGLK